ncbi:Oidioi.mRNA.OKI2018_I69.PAR.g9461.t1.cds [Oikopleura dioica]|uniref:Oidioi.mRNA.OKI2018_I69.PAR.g9461.t1.cds n=1 Tax=Oikopleura dioica TaxID=34765 RepID=A0ABN7RR60_OIKDI|nr:Oidioi.mRNA.OKI2018_I69.PAR.g9461.t1.cds [Oikopleura dioica]
MATQIGSCGTSVGMLLFPLIIAWLLETFTVPGYYLILGGIYLNLLIAGALMHTPKSKEAKIIAEKKEEKLIANQEEMEENQTTAQFDSKIFSLPELYLYLLAQAILNGGYFAGVLYVSPFSQSAYSLTPVTAASMITIMGASELACRIPIGILSDRDWMNRHYFLCFNCLNLSLSFFLLPLMPSNIHFAFVCIYSGAFQGGWGGLSFVTLSDFLKVVKLEGQLMSCVGLSTAFNGISCMIVSVGMGQIVQSTGSYILPFYIGGAMVALAGLLSGLIGIISSRRTANGL